MISRLGHLFLSGIFITGGFKAFLNPGYRVNPVAKAGIPEPKLAVEMNGLADAIHEKSWFAWWASHHAA